jgi:hypothetical protein
VLKAVCKMFYSSADTDWITSLEQTSPVPQ